MKPTCSFHDGLDCGYVRRVQDEIALPVSWELPAVDFVWAVGDHHHLFESPARPSQRSASYCDRGSMSRAASADTSKPTHMRDDIVYYLRIAGRPSNVPLLV